MQLKKTMGGAGQRGRGKSGTSAIMSTLDIFNLKNMQMKVKLFG